MRISTKLLTLLVMLFSTVILSFNLALGQFEWEKHEGNPILTVGSQGTWNDMYIASPSIIFDGNVYHMWFEGRNSSTYFTGIGYASSSDGIEWTENENNPVFQASGGNAWDAHNVACPCVIFDNSLFHMWYTGGRNDTNGKPSIGYATSIDGKNWERFEGNPVLIPSSENWESLLVMEPSVIKIGSVYHMWYNGFSDSYVYSIGYATSSDGKIWQKYENNPVIQPEDVGARTSVELCQVIFSDGKFKMLFDYGNGLQRIGYAESSDGINWVFFEGNPVLEWGVPGEFDDSSVYLCSILKNDNKYQMWYSGGDGTVKSEIGYALCQIRDHDLSVTSTFDSLRSIPLWSKSRCTPKMKIANYGTSDEFDFVVNCEIDSAGIPIHHEELIVASFEKLSLEFKEISFKEWNFNPNKECTYNISYYTSLISDQNLPNDTIKTTIVASNLIDDFENGNFKWNHDPCWVISQASSMSGKNCLRNTAGNFYENNVDSWVDFKFSFDLSQLSDAYISFWTRYIIEQDKDFGSLEVSSDNGQTWNQLGDAFTGIQGTWINATRSLAEHCGPGFDDVIIRFHFVSDAFQPYPMLGWFIDDLEIYPSSTGVSTFDENDQALQSYSLSGNYPNPFNSCTNIGYQVPIHNNVRIAVYDLLGREIKTLVDRDHQPGKYLVGWNGKDNSGRFVSSGLYIYRIETKSYSDSRKLLFLK